MVGQVLLKKYKVMRPLDEGGMSRIFVAKQLDHPREVVVKVLKPEYAAQQKAREHFRREIHILSRFNHPNAVGYYDADPSDSKAPFLVMEYLRGIDLAGLLAREGRFAPDRAGRILVQLCDVLQAAHDVGIVHHDLKPGNIFIIYPGTPQETVKLMDFGLARMSSLLYIDPEDVTRLHLDDAPSTAGTPEYIAPEQLRGTTVDRRSDIYSLGVILFEMLTGKRPFDRPTVDQILIAHTDDPPPTFAEMGLGDQISHHIEQVVRRCLAKSPDDRYQQASELIYHYEKALGRRLTHGRTFGTPAKEGSTAEDNSTPQGRVSAVLNKARAILSREPGTTPVPTPAPHSRAVQTGRYPVVTNQNAPPPVEPSRSLARIDPHQIQHRIEAVMPEAMALLKLKGFIFDIGGEVVESVPGMIRVRLGAAQGQSNAGVLSWFSGSRQTPTFPPTDLELHMAHSDPSQPSKLTITLVMRPLERGAASSAWRDACQRVLRELQAYVMGRTID